MHRHDPTDTKPCPHMRLLVSAQADGALAGIVRWYTQRHLDGCPQCRKGMAAILQVRERLRAGDSQGASLSGEQWDAVEAAWRHAEHSRPAP